MAEVMKFDEYKVREMDVRYVVLMKVYRSMALRLL